MNDDPLIGRRLANFRVERVLGRGGMAQVYFGRDVKLQRPVAIKVIDMRFRGDPGYARRFVSEARMVATWRHQNIVQVYYADNEEDLYYFVMEYIDGMDLSGLIAAYAAEGELMPHDDVIAIGGAVASALDYAHKQGVIHRDVKPSNVMVASDDRVILTDFGLAMDVEQGTIGEAFGTPHYIPPEQAQDSANAVPQSDLYSLGIMLYELLTGAVPFDDPSPTSIVMKHITQSPPPPGDLNPELSPQTEAVLLKALAKTPEERYPTGDELITALDEALKAAIGDPQAASRPPPPRTLSHETVAEKVALHLDNNLTLEAPQEPRIPPPTQDNIPVASRRALQTATGDRRSSGLVIGFALMAIVLAVIGVLFVISRGSGDDDLSGAAGLPTVAASGILATNTSVPSMTPVPATATSEPSATAIPPTATSLPSATAIPASATPVPASPTPIPETAIPLPAGPTAAPVGWAYTRMIYDANAFYWMNDSNRNIEVNHYTFQRLSDGANFDGNRFAFYTMERGRCVQVIFTDVGTLGCPEGRRPNAWFTPTRTQGVDFWTGGTGQFRVLYQGQEIALCDIAAGFCEVYVP